MKKIDKKFQEKYLCSRPATELKKLQLIRLTFILGSLALIIATMFIKQTAISFLVESKNKFATTVQTLYVFLVIASTLVAIYTLVCSLTRYKLDKTLLAKNAPKKGFSSTWSAFKWLVSFLSLYGILIIGLMIYKFSVGSLAILILIALSVTSSVFAIKTGKIAYDGTMTLLSEDKQGEKEMEKMLSEEVEEFYD